MNADNMNVEGNLEKLGLVLPKAPSAVANYLGFVVLDGFVFISGQLPIVDGEVLYTGKVGKDLTREIAKDAARLCGLNVLSQLSAAIHEDWTRVRKCIRIGGFVQSQDTFSEQPFVINGASDLIVNVFGHAVGAHARAAVGVNALPRNAAVEVEALFSIL